MPKLVFDYEEVKLMVELKSQCTGTKKLESFIDFLQENHQGIENDFLSVITDYQSNGRNMRIAFTSNAPWSQKINNPIYTKASGAVYRFHFKLYIELSDEALNDFQRANSGFLNAKKHEFEPPQKSEFMFKETGADHVEIVNGYFEVLEKTDGAVELLEPIIKTPPEIGGYSMGLLAAISESGEEIMKVFDNIHSESKAMKVIEEIRSMEEKAIAAHLFSIALPSDVEIFVNLGEGKETVPIASTVVRTLLTKDFKY